MIAFLSTWLQQITDAARSVRVQYDWGLLAAAVAVAVGYAIYLYWGESRMGRRGRLGLAAARIGALALLIAALFQPVMAVTQTVTPRSNVLVLIDTSASMKIADIRKDTADLQDAAMALGKMPFGASAVLPEKQKSELASIARIDLAKGILTHPDLTLLEHLGGQFGVDTYGFGQGLKVLGVDNPSAEALKAIDAADAQTELGSALQAAVDRHPGQSIAGVIVLSDGASNAGADALAVARQLGQRGIPVFPIGLGLAQPDDVQVRDLIVPDVVFADDLVPVRVQVVSHGYEKRTADLVVSLDGKPKARKSITLSGEPQFEELFVEADRKGGVAKVAVEISPQTGEADEHNNHVERSIRVLDDKIKVLYIEGSPRWEYRYLRGVLMRDRRLECKFIMTEGDSDLPRASKEYLAKFPEDAAESFKFDLVIIGDVPSSYFTQAQLARMEELVREGSTSLLMLAGHKHAPSSYGNTPLGAVLPVRIGAGKWEEIDKNVHPVMTAAGRASMIMSLEPAEKDNDAIWANVKPMYRVPTMVSAKAGATVLADLSDSTGRSESFPLVAWQRYGTGKSLFVGTDRLFRLRYKTGDEYHVRFWVQTIQFLTLSRLLGDNQRIHLDCEPRTCQAGQRVRIFASVLDDGYSPSRGRSFGVFVERTDTESATPPAQPLELQAVPDAIGLYQGFFIPEHEGRYRVRADASQQKFSNLMEFEAAPPQVEQLEPAMQEPLLRQIAQLSGGRYFTVRDLPELAGAVQAQVRPQIVRKETPLWDRGLVAALFLGCVGLEWLVRRKNDMA